MDSTTGGHGGNVEVEPERRKSRLLVFRDRLLSPHLKEYRPQAAESLHHRQQAAEAAADGRPLPVHGTPEGSTCCQLSLRSTPTSGADLNMPGSVAPNGVTQPSSPASQRFHRGQTDGRPRPTEGPSPTNITGMRSSDCPPPPLRTGATKQRGLTKSALPLTKSFAVGGGDARRVASARSARVRQRSPTNPVDRPLRRSGAVAISGVASADDVAVISSSSDAYSDEAASPATGIHRKSPAAAASPPPGLMSRIVVRKTGRRIADEASQSTRVPVKVSDGDGSSSNAESAVGSEGPTTTIAEEADAAREQFPFIFNLLRGANAAQGFGPRTAAAEAGGADTRRGGKTSPHQRQQQLQQQQQQRTPAGSTCRQEDDARPSSSASGRESSGRPEAVRPQRRLLPSTSDDVITTSDSSVSQSGRALASSGADALLDSSGLTAVVSTPLVSRAALMASRRAHQLHTVAADIHASPEDVDSDANTDVTSADGRCRASPGQYCSATVGSFRRRDNLRSSLPVVSALNKSMERPLGVVFLVFRNETKPGLLPNEVTTINTVWALFVRAFPATLSMQWFESSKWTVFYLDPAVGVYRVLQDLRTITDRSILRLEESETCLTIDASHPTPSFDADATRVKVCAAGRTTSSTPPPPPPPCKSPLAARRPARASTKALTQDEAMSNQSQFRAYNQQRHHHTPTATVNDSPASKTSPCERLSAMETRVDSLAALVQCAILRPTTSIDSLASDTSQATAVHKSPASDRAQSVLEAAADDDVTGSVSAICRRARELKNDARQLRQAHIDHVTGTKQLLQATLSELTAAITRHGVGGVTKTVRHHVVEEQGGYCVDAARVEEQLRNLEACVEQLRTGVVGGGTLVVQTDVEAMVLALGHIGRSLASLRGRLNHLQDRMQPVMTAEIEIVVQEERFIKEEPHRLDKSVVRCKQLSGTLSTLKKLAIVQGNDATPSGGSEQISSSKQKQHGAPDAGVVRNQIQFQARRRQSSDDNDASAANHANTTISVEATSRCRAQTNSRRSSYSGTSTGSDAPSTNGHSDDNSGDTSTYEDGFGDAAEAKRGRVPVPDGAPPAPPPRRSVPPPTSPVAEVWQRHAGRPATVDVHRRALAAGFTVGETPKSCPSSPLLDAGDWVAMRRAGLPGVRRVQGPPPAAQNESVAASGRTSTSAVSRRTRLPGLSGTGHGHRDVR